MERARASAEARDGPGRRTRRAARPLAGQGTTRITDTTARAEALADRLEASVSKRALAEFVAGRAVVAGIMDRRTDAQIEADLLARLRRHEQVAALRALGGNGQKGGGNG